jgi:hypothetical protein
LASFVMSPLAWKAVRYGALAAMALYASRQRASEPKDVEHQRTLDDLPEGFTAHAHRAEAERGVHGTGRFRRAIRLPNGGVLEIEAAGLGRLRLRRAG